MLLCLAFVSCFCVMLLYHAFVSCFCVMLLCLAFISCFCVMIMCHALCVIPDWLSFYRMLDWLFFSQSAWLFFFTESFNNIFSHSLYLSPKVQLFFSLTAYLWTFLSLLDSFFTPFWNENLNNLFPAKSYIFMLNSVIHYLFFNIIFIANQY